jgi:hypothetical protein
MKDGSLEFINTRNSKLARLDKLACPSEEELAFVEEHSIRLDVSDREAPSLALLYPFTLLHVHPKGHFGRQRILFRHCIKISPELIVGWQDPTPIWIGLKGVAIESSRNVTSTA